MARELDHHLSYRAVKTRNKKSSLVVLTNGALVVRLKPEYEELLTLYTAKIVRDEFKRVNGVELIITVGE